MTSTTIKVSRETRDRLKRQAAATGTSLSEHLARLADLADRRARMESLRTAISQTPSAEADAYSTEVQEWEAVELTDASRDQ
ncbi:hypothetical protein [Demetria terragena]|uniref:hypothetical protein n=1 Tax=Demetria terragena TaxID=63959 RepID=UPI00037F51AE|nr:hypothetical protein [Demetria terragena]